MAIHHHESQQTQSSYAFSLEDSLYCKEEQEQQHWDDDDYEELDQDPQITTNYKSTPPTFPLFLSEQDLFWEQEELLSLFSKEKESLLLCFDETEHLLCFARTEAVDWILKVRAHFGFSCLTAILAINYVDRFICTLHFEKDKPWMIQLVAVTCLSLAAKVEETQVPLLLDLQVEDTKYVFEAKTIQRMEIIIMSALQWRMNPVTPLSFLDHITRRLGLKTNLHWEFLKQCELLLLSAVADSRFVGYLPSVLATGAMIHVIKQVEPSNCVEYENQLMLVLKTSKEKVNECYKLIEGLSKTSHLNGQRKQQKQKRKHEEIGGGGGGGSSTIGVILDDATFSCYDNSSTNNDNSWAPVGPLRFKKIRVQQDYHYFQLPSPTLSFSL